VETKNKIDQDFNNFNLAIEKRAEEEIKKISADVDALRLQAVKLADALTNSSILSEKSRKQEKS
jgi:hypothetical protein